MAGTGATDRQLATIRTESRKAGFDDPQDACKAAGIESRNWKYDLSRPDASDLITQLRDEGLTPPEKPAAPAVWTETGDGMSAADAISTLGHTITVTGKSGKTYTADIWEIKLNAERTPVLSGITDDKRAFRISLSKVTGWGFHD